MSNSRPRRPFPQSRRVAGRGRRTASVPPIRGPGWVGRILSRHVRWLAAGIAAAASGVLISILTSIPSQMLDEPSLRDQVRAGPDIQATVEVTNDDGDYTIATVGQYDIRPDDKLRSSVDIQSVVNLVHQVREGGGFDVGRLRVRLLLEGRRNQQLQVTDLFLSDINQLPIVRGTLLQANQEGAVENEHIIFNLSEELPRARLLKDDGSVSDSYFADHSISLMDREQVVLLAEFRSRVATASTFRLTMKYVIGGELRSIVIDNHGQPFRVTPPSCNASGSFSANYDHAYTMEAGTKEGALALSPSLDSENVVVGICG